MVFRLATCLSLVALPALAEVPRVVTDIPPVQSLVAQVMGDLGPVELLLEKGADEHDFQLRPSQMRGIAAADLVIWVGPELTPWLERAMAASEAGSLRLLQSDGTQRRDLAEGEDGAHDHDHGHGGVDPHAWLDPDNARHWLSVIADALAASDPEHADIYRANAAQADARIVVMDTGVRASLAGMQDRGILTYHAAYGYFAAHYGLTQVWSLASGDAAAPGAAAVSDLTEKARSGEFACAFPEAQHPTGLLDQVVEGTSTRLGRALDPVGSTLDTGPDTYETLMRNIADSLTECLTR